MIANVNGANNTVVGGYAAPASTGSLNLIMGYLTAQNMTTGNNNIVIGSSTSPGAAPNLTTGSGNILIQGDVPTGSTSNFLNIGNAIFANGLGSVSNVGILTNTPAYPLDVQGNTNQRTPWFCRFTHR